MPHLICPACGLTSYTAARYASAERCPRCKGALTGGDSAEGRVRRWNLGAVRAVARGKEVEHGTR